MQLSDLFNFTTINSYLVSIGVDIESYRPLLDDSAELLGRWKEKLITNFQSVTASNSLLFSDFQLLLLKTILILLIVNLALIVIYWRKYGTVITDRFIRPSTLKEIEELKLSVARLKLPKDYTPRI